MSEGVRRLQQDTILRGSLADVARHRERRRLRLVTRLAIVAWLCVLWFGLRAVMNESLLPSLPHIPPEYASMIAIVVLLSFVLLLPFVGSGRSPHVLYRPSEIDVGLEDVRGAHVVKEEVVRTLNLFLASATFERELGGTPRRAVLFAGPPGTGKTHLAKAMAREAGVPFLFVSSSAFQSMYYGQTNRKIRSYFRALRKYAREEGGAIGFIEEFDAIGAARAGMGTSTPREGVAGVVNELLIQLQSFDEPTTSQRLRGWFIDRINRVLPTESQWRKHLPERANVLVVGATNRADDLDPALLRPGRFDRTIQFELPNRAERREIIDFYLDRKAHVPALDLKPARDRLAAATAEMSPAVIEHLFDEALVWALRRGAQAFDAHDLEQARLTQSMGMRTPFDYTEEERLVIATHEAGHATLAYLAGRDDRDPTAPPSRLAPIRRLDVLSIAKRGGALGLLAHSDNDEHLSRSRSELLSLIRIGLAGMVAEEIAFGEASTGPIEDLSSATLTAAMMVGALGMGDSLASLYAAKTVLGNDIVAKVLADDAARAATERILDQARADVDHALRRHRAIWEALRDALLEREELIGDEIIDVIHEAVVRDEIRVVDLRQVGNGSEPNRGPVPIDVPVPRELPDRSEPVPQ
jgi:cell division protease FtsH